MSTIQRLFSASLALVLLFGVGFIINPGESNAQSIDLSTASTAELESVLSDLQRQVDDLNRRVNPQPPVDDGSDDTVDDDGDAEIRDDSGESPINFELDSVLSTGSQGQQVRWVQQLLAQHPNIYPEGLVTGYYGQLTTQAVNRLQRQGGFPTVGRVGQQTLDYLQSISDPIGRDRDRGGSEDNEGSDDDGDDASGEPEQCDIVTVREDQPAELDTGNGVVSVALVDATGNVTVTIDGEQVSFSGEGDQMAVGDNTYVLNTVISGPRSGLSIATISVLCDDDGSGDDEDPETRSVTLTDTFRGNEFTATLTPQDGNTWRYRVFGMAPSPNYEFAVEAGGMEIIGILEQTTGNQPITPTGPDQLRAPEGVPSPVSDSGAFTIDSSESAEDVTFDIRAGQIDDEDPDDGGIPEEPEQCDITGVREGQEAQLNTGSGVVTVELIGTAGNITAEIDGERVSFADEGDQATVGGRTYVLNSVRTIGGPRSGLSIATISVLCDEDDGEGGGDDYGGGDSDQTYDDQLILDRTVGNVTEFPVKMGDVNGDGSVTNDDSQMLVSFTNDLSGMSSRQKVAADVNGDGRISGSDVNQIRSYATSKFLGGFAGYIDGAVTEFEVTAGDVNEDGSITAQDASLIQDYVRGDADLSTEQKVAADVDGDGEITAEGIGSRDGNDYGGDDDRDRDREDDDDGNDDEDDGDEPERESVTLTDTFMGTYEFTATVTRMTDTTWQYTVEGSVPSPNYNMEVLTDGPLIVASIEQGTGAAPTVVSDVRERGRFSIDSDREAEDIRFDVRGDSDSGEAQEPTARLELSGTSGDEVSVGQEFRVDASGSSDPNSDELEYQWEVDSPSGQSGGGDFSDQSGIQTSFDEPGTATFEVTVRDEDDNTDSESITVTIKEEEDADPNDAQMILDRTVGEIDEFPADEILLGDVNQDGSVTAQDAMLIQDYVAGDADLTFRQKTAADVDGDGEITADDTSGEDNDGGGGSDNPFGTPTQPELPRLPGGVLVR